VHWIIDPEANGWFVEWTSETPLGAAPPLVHRREILRLPTSGETGGHHSSGKSRIHPQLVDLDERFSGCLLVESVEGGERRREYYKEGVGLVGLDVFSPAGAGEGRLVFSRRLEEWGVRAAE
jgi:hypothetical protein